MSAFASALLRPSFSSALLAQGAEQPVQNPVSAGDTLVNTTEFRLPTSGMTSFGYEFGIEQLQADSLSEIHPVINGRIVLRPDSVRALTDSLLHAWLDALQREPTPALQHLPVAAMNFRARRDAEVQQHIAAWLATPGLPLQRRARVLAYAVALFANGTPAFPSSPARLPLAFHYLAMLDSLHGPRTDARQLFRNYDDSPVFIPGAKFAARLALMKAYVRYGDMAKARAMGLEAYRAIDESDEYYVRSLMTGVPLDLGLALTERPEGRKTLDSLLAVLKQVSIAPPALLVKDTAYRRHEQWRLATWASTDSMLAALGRPVGRSFVATHWLNQPVPSLPSDAAPNARVKRLDDGIIRIVAVGRYGCGWCRRLVGEMRHWVLPPGVELLFLDFTEGVWGEEPVLPDEETQHLAHWFLDVKHVRYPVAIWAGPLDTLFDGAVQPRPAPFWKKMGGAATPLVIVTDGHGVVRFRADAYSDYEPYRAVINTLVAERARQQHEPGQMRPVGTGSRGAEAPNEVHPGALSTQAPSTDQGTETTAPSRLW